MARKAVSTTLPHTAEVRLRLAAPDFGSLAAEAGRALARIELGREPPPGAGAWREIGVTASDRDAALVDWLNELIYLAEAERWVATEFVPDEARAQRLRMRARGVAVKDAPARVKAATFHGLHVTEVPGGLAADVVLDV